MISSVLARLELASAVQAAGRDRRLADPSRWLARFDADCRDGGWLSLIALRPDDVLPAAHSILGRQAVRTLDAIHLAVALTDGVALAHPDPLLFVTRDRAQADAARALGLPTG